MTLHLFYSIALIAAFAICGGFALLCAYLHDRDSGYIRPMRRNRK